MKLKNLLLLTLWLGAPAVLDAAELRLAAIFGEHSVFQREQAVPVWGWADAGARVTVEFAGQSKTADADASGKWQVQLEAMKASAEPRVLTVRAGTTVTPLTVHDVLVGEVWLASGQSNMGFLLAGAHNAATEIPKATDPQLRFFTVVRNTAGEPLSDLRGLWQPSDPLTAKEFSAAAYFFARELRTRLQCPVGIIHSSWGGTAIQTWMGIDSFRQAPLWGYIQKWGEAMAVHRRIEPGQVEDYQRELKLWKAEVLPGFNEALKRWREAKAAGGRPGPKPQPARAEPVNPDPIGIPGPSLQPSVPGVIYNAMIAPLAPYAMRGVIWYQGEANGGDGMEYRSLFPRLIGDWRQRWGAELAFVFVQLAGWDHGSPSDEPDWPFLREAQLLTLKTPRTAMAVAIDVGDPRDVHPKDKLDVGLRLALAARKVAYGEELVYSGPLYEGFESGGGVLRVKFTGGGLIIGQAPWLADGVAALPADELVGFAVAGEDRRWFAARAVIEGGSVVLSSDKVPKPVAARYGWANAPRCNLYNKEGLPASPFRTDDWPATASHRKGL